jgi:hypothetical protein
MPVDLRAVEAAVAGQAEAQLGQRDPWIDWRWVRVLRPGDSPQRVVGLLGRPERAGPARLIYHDVVIDRAIPDSRHGLRIALNEGKVQSVSLEPAPTD